MSFSEAAQLRPFERRMWAIAFGIYRRGDDDFNWESMTFPRETKSVPSTNPKFKV